MIRRFLKYYKPYLLILSGVIFGTFFVAGLELVFPLVVKHLIDAVLPARDMMALFAGAAVLLCLYILEFAGQYAIQYYGHIMCASIEHDMRKELFRHIESQPFRYFDNEKTGQLLSRLTGDLTEIGELAFRGPNDVLLCAVIMTGTLAAMLIMNWELAILIGGLLIFKSIHTVKINRKMKNAFRRTREKAGELSARAEESLSGIRLVKAFAREDFELQRFSAKSEELRNTRFSSYKLLAYFSGGINFFTNFINVAVIFVGGYMIATNALRISDFVAFLLYVNIFMKPVFRLTILTEMYQRGMAGFHRFTEIMDTEPTVCDSENPLSVGQLEGRIVFDHVGFAYGGGHKVLSDLSFTIPKGKRVAFVGETGAGKSTLVNLLLRFYEVTEGAISIDGHNINEYRQRELREQIGIVQQDVFLFGDTIADNIAYGKEHATREDIVAAARMAAADDFIRELPHGYDTTVGERGVKLSGGQKQRIAIARVFLKNPPIVIFDEATSALDTQTEKVVQRTLDTLAKDRTTIVIAHRLSTVREADNIFVLDHGCIIETGTHEKLLALRGKYYALYEAQKKTGKQENEEES